MQIRSKRNNLSKMGLLILGSSLLLMGCGKDNKVVYDVDSITVDEEDTGVIYVPENSESVLTDRDPNVKGILKEEVVEPLKLTVGTVTYDSYEDYNKAYDEFYANKLATFQIPESVTTIEDGALGTNKLTTIHFPSSLTSIGVHAFQTNNLEAIYLPDSIESVGYEAFRTNFIKTVYAPSHIENEFMVNFVFDLQTPTVTFY